MNQPHAELTTGDVRVGGTAIGEAEIAREMQHHRADDPARSRAEAARALVVRELVRLEIERLGLREVATPRAGESEEEACIRALIDREVRVEEPDETACRRFFEHNRERLRGRDRVRVRHILLAAAPDDLAARADARDLGERLIGELRVAPERFDEFAQRHSACPSKDDRGDLGWLESGDTTPEFERQVFRLATGLAGLTVESRWGHHVVQVDAVERGEPLEFEQARPRVAAYLEAQARQHALHDYLRDLARRHEVQGLPDGAVTS